MYESTETRKPEIEVKRRLIFWFTIINEKFYKSANESSITFVFHSPFKFDHDRLPSQIVQERLWVYWYSLQAQWPKDFRTTTTIIRKEWFSKQKLITTPQLKLNMCNQILWAQQHRIISNNIQFFLFKASKHVKRPKSEIKQESELTHYTKTLEHHRFS